MTRRSAGVDPVRFRWCHHGFAAACRAAGVGFSFGFPVTAPVRAAVRCWPRRPAWSTCPRGVQLIGFADQPDLARCEIAAFRYRVLHVAARISRAARQTRLRIDRTWRWATAITTGWHRIRAAFP